MPFTFVLDDPSGNSFIENPIAPKVSGGLTLCVGLECKLIGFVFGICVAVAVGSTVDGAPLLEDKGTE